MCFLALVITIFICINQINCDWELIWKDEFNDPNYTKEHWTIENEINNCNGNWVEQLNCNTDKNVAVNDGKLTIKAVSEDFLNKRFTAGKLTMINSFTHGRIEINASLPVGKLLRPAIYLLPEVQDPNNWKLKGQIELMSNLQNQSIYSAIFYVPNDEINVFESVKSLNEFNTYTLEWNSNEILGIFNNECYYFKFDLNRILAPDYKRPGEPFDGGFKLMIILGVGGKYWFKPNELTNNEASSWIEPNFIIDYVRLYHYNNKIDIGTNITNYTSCITNSVDKISVDKNSCNVNSIASILFSIFNLLINKILLDFIMKLR